jgi:predicted nucleic acid-binding protein
MWRGRFRKIEEGRFGLSSRSYVFDAGAISLYYAGSEAVRPYFLRVFSGRARGFVSEVNLAEFYYKTAEKKDLQSAEAWYLQVRHSRINVVSPNEQITRQAALWKVRRKGLSLADCYALATRENVRALLLTTDSTLKEASRKTTLHIPLE